MKMAIVTKSEIVTLINSYIGLEELGSYLSSDDIDIKKCILLESEEGKTLLLNVIAEQDYGEVCYYASLECESFFNEWKVNDIVTNQESFPDASWSDGFEMYCEDYGLTFVNTDNI